MSFDINSFVIDRPIRGTMFASGTYSLLWSLTQIEEFTIKMSADNKEIVDAVGVPIMVFERNKKCELSGTNSLFDLGLLAAQSGTTKNVATALNTIKVTTCEKITWVTGTDVELKHVPIGTSGSEIPYIYALNGDGTVGTKYTVGAAAGNGVYKIVASTKKITPPTNVSTASDALVFYDYTADGTTDNGAVSVTANAKDFPSAGRFFLEVLGYDTCDSTTKYYAYVDFPSAKLMSNFDLTLNADGKHPFSIQCMQSYCDANKKLFTITIPEQ